MMPQKAKDSSKEQVKQQGCYALRDTGHKCKQEKVKEEGTCTICLGLTIPCESLAKISWERVPLLKDLPIWFNKGDLQRRQGENGESHFRESFQSQDHAGDVPEISLAARFSKLSGLLWGAQDFKIAGIKRESLLLWVRSSWRASFVPAAVGLLNRLVGESGAENRLASSGLGRKGLCDSLDTGTGASEEEVLHQQACGASGGRKKVLP